MASIQKKGKNYYIVTNVDGKQKWIPGKSTKLETRKYMTEVLYKLDNNIIRKDTINITVKEYLSNWFNTYCVNNLKLTTYTGYKQYIDSYIIPRIGGVRLIDLKPMTIQDMYYDILKNGRVNGKEPLNPKSVIQAHRILRKALKNAVKMQIINSNPCDYVELPKKKKYKYMILHEDEVKGFLKAFKDTEIYAAVVIGLTLGLRRGEVLALLWSDINLEEKTMTISKTLVVSSYQVKVDTPKTESSNRILLVPDFILALLYRIKAERNAKDSDYIVVNLKGDRWNPSSFSGRFIELRDRKNLKKVRFHDLRHTNATIMYKSNIKTKVMQERLGHANISTTLDIYTHLFKEDQREVAKIFDDKNFVD